MTHCAARQLFAAVNYMSQIAEHSRHPKYYEYLWSNHDVDFIFTSSYLFEEFKTCDIVLTYDWQKKELKFFLANDERKRLSEENVHKYLDEFDAWKDSMGATMARGE